MPSRKSAIPTLPQFLWKAYAEDSDRVRVKQEDNIRDETEHPEEEEIPVIVSPIAAQHLPTDSLALYQSKGSTDSLPSPQLSAQGYIPHTELYSGLWSNVSTFLPYLDPDLTRPDQSGLDRRLTRYSRNILAANHQPPRNRPA